MATRMQQRRGTASQWTSADPILAAGEIGFETDTGKFKIGNGSSIWSALNYYVDANAILDGAPGVLDTLNELAAALGDDPAFITTVATNLSTHASDTTSVHGIANTADLATQSYVTDAISNATVDQSALAGEGIAWNGATEQFDIDSTVVTLDGEQTLTNKTLEGVSIDGTSTAVTQVGADSSTKIATTEFVQGRLNAVVGSAPELLNTLAELSSALNDNENFATDIISAIDSRLAKSGDTMTGALTLSGDPSQGLHAATKDYVDAAAVHNADTLEVHGIANTADLAVHADISDAIDTHNALTTGVHGITNTADLATKAYADAAEVHNALTTGVHGITNTADLATKAYADAAEVHNAATTGVHGITNTADLATKDYVDAAEVHNAATTGVHGITNTADIVYDADLTAHNNDTTDVHGIADTSALVLTDDSRLTDTRTPTDNTVSTEKIVNSAVTADKLAGDSVTESKIADGAVTSGKIANGTIVNADINDSAEIAQSKISGLTTDLAAKAPLDSPTFTGTVAGITKSMVGLSNVDNTSDANKPVSTATQSALDLKANLAGPTFTGTTTAASLTVTGNLTVQGTTTTVSSSNLSISDPMIYLGEGNSGNSSDLGFVSNFNDGTYQHSGLVRDASDNKWKLFKGVTDEPTTTVNFTQGSMDDLKVAALEATTVTPSSGVVFSDGTQTKEGVPSRTTIVQKTDSYTLSALTERDNFIEINKATAVTLTIPANSTVAYPVGTSIDILQTGAGQVTIAGAVGVTVNATPGLKLRTQWSSATLFKRATDTWVVMGDLSA